jgi:glycosyltransferase involved in cell wall biosynthesis
VNYFDPVRPESIAEAIRDLVDHPQKAARLGKKAFELSRSYDWEHCARKSYELIRNAYRGHRSLFLKRPAWMIGPLPPPLIGQSLAFKMICDEMKRLGLPHRVLNIGGRQLERRDGSFSFSRSTNLIHPFLLASTLPFRKPKIVYLTIAQSWFGFLRDMLFIFFSSFGNHRIILHLHGGNYERFYSCQPVFRKALIRWSLSKAEKIVVLSESLKSMFDFLPDSRTRIAVVHNGLPSRSPGESLEPKSLPENGKSPVRILYLSNLIESKGYLDVLEAVHLLDSGHGISLEVHFCGKFLLGSDIHNYPSPRKAREDFEGRVREYGLSNRVVWKESVEGREKQEELGKAHFFILPTYYNNEGQPLSVIEAIASGCCVITTRYRAIPELVDHGNAGLFVEAKNPTAIAESVLSMIRDPKRYREVSRRAVRHYREHFTREAHLESLKREIFNIDPESMKGP